MDQINNSDVELMCTALKMRGELEIQNRKYKFKNYKRCIVGEDAIQWLADKANHCARQQAVALFCDFIRNGLLMCCISDTEHVNTLYRSNSKIKASKSTSYKKEQAPYKFLWDVIDVDNIEIRFAETVPVSYIVHSNEWNIEQKAYQIYRKYVETESHLEINVSNQMKKMFAKYVDDLEESFHDVSLVRLLDLFDTLRLEMRLYLEHSFKRMAPIYKHEVEEKRVRGLSIRRNRQQSDMETNSLFDEIAARPEPLELPRNFNMVF